MKNVFVYLQDACEKRELDANRICEYLCKNNYKIVDNPKQADIIIIVTCAALNELIDRALVKIKEFQKYDAELIISGCLPEIEKEKLAKIFHGKTISTKDIEKIDELFPKNKVKFKDIDDAHFIYLNVYEGTPLGKVKKFFRKVKLIENIYVKIYDYILINLFGNNSLIYRWFAKRYSTYHVRISGGCLGNCSFCAVKKGIGLHKSKPIDQCIAEFKKGLDEGNKNIAINADDIGAYGLDIGSNFPKILDKLTDIPGEYKLSIRAIHPTWIVRYIDDLEKILKKHKIASIDLPIQSGSSCILKLMQRYSDTEKMKNAFQRLKDSYPDLKLYTFIIAGFPTETEEDFKQSLSFVKEMKFNAGLIFSFSCMKGTKAEEIEPKISQKEIFERIKYAKKYFKDLGYNVIYFKKPHFFAFEKKEL